MNIITLLKYITSHPLNQNNKAGAVYRFFKWQLNTLINPYPVVYPFTEKAKLILRKGMTGATGNLYCGLHDYSDMAFVLHLLREGDLFMDIGANVGSYTVLASGHVGANTFAFEPVPATFSHLENNVSINRISNRVKAFNLALGSQPGKIAFTSEFDTVNHVAVGTEGHVIEVRVETLDGLLSGQQQPLLIKIDVEGFETEVIKGAGETLRQNELKAIIIELNGSGTRYNFDDREIHGILLEFGFRPYLYDPRERRLTGVEKFGTHNTIYIRDLDFVARRLTEAPKVKVLNNEI